MEFKLNQLSFWKVNSAGVKRFIVSVLLLLVSLGILFFFIEENQVKENLYHVAIFVHTFCILSIILKLLDERYGKKFLFQLVGLFVWIFVSFVVFTSLNEGFFQVVTAYLALVFTCFFLWVALYWKDVNDLRLSIFFCRFVDEFLKRLVVFLLFVFVESGVFDNETIFFLFSLLFYGFLHISFVCSIPSKEELFEGDVPLKDASSLIFVILRSVVLMIITYVIFYNVELYNNIDELQYLYLFFFPLAYLLFFFVLTIGYFSRQLKEENGVWYVVMYGLAWVANVLMSYAIYMLMSEYVSEWLLFALLANIVCYLLLILLRTPLKRRWVTIFFSSFILIPVFLFGPWSFFNIEKRITENRVISSIKEFGFEYPLKSENDVKIWKYSMSADDREKMKRILYRYDDKYEMSDLMEVRLKNKYVELENEEKDNKRLYYYENLEDELQIPKGFSRICPDEFNQSVHLNKEEVNGEKTTDIMLDINVRGTCHEIYIPIDTALYYGGMSLDDCEVFLVKDKIIHDGKEVKVCLLIKEFMFKVYEEQVTDYSVKGSLFLE